MVHTSQLIDLWSWCRDFAILAHICLRAIWSWSPWRCFPMLATLRVRPKDRALWRESKFDLQAILLSSSIQSCFKTCSCLDQSLETSTFRSSLRLLWLYETLSEHDIRNVRAHDWENLNSCELLGRLWAGVKIWLNGYGGYFSFTYFQLVWWSRLFQAHHWWNQLWLRTYPRMFCRIRQCVSTI